MPSAYPWLNILSNAGFNLPGPPVFAVVEAAIFGGDCGAYTWAFCGSCFTTGFGFSDDDPPVTVGRVPID